MNPEKYTSENFKVFQNCIFQKNMRKPTAKIKHPIYNA